MSSPTPSPSAHVSLVDQVWFIAVIAVVGTLVVIGIPTIAITVGVTCVHCKHREGKIYSE